MFRKQTEFPFHVNLRESILTEKWHTAALRKRMAEFELLDSKFRLFDTIEGF